jgi:CubicO group peptidase (beta-lactamase class C family)
MKMGCEMGLNSINIKERMNHFLVQGLSLVLIEDGQISAEEQYGLREADTTNSVKGDSIFNACSISKFLTGMLVMVLAGRGSLDLDEDVNRRLKSGRSLMLDLLLTIKLLCGSCSAINQE